MTAHPTPLGALIRGLIAGAAGTAVMTGYQELVQSGGAGGGKEHVRAALGVPAEGAGSYHLVYGVGVAGAYEALDSVAG